MHSSMKPIVQRGYVEVFRLLWRRKWGIFGFVGAVIVISVFVLASMPNIYRASAVVKPVSPDTGKTSSPLEYLTSLGLSFTSSTKVEDLEVLLKSQDLTTRVFRKYDLWKEVFADEIDKTTGKRKMNLISRLPVGEKQMDVFGDWDAIRAARKALAVRTDTRRGVLTVSFESQDPTLSSRIVKYYLEEAKSRLQEEEFERARINKNFLEDQIAKTIDALTRERLYLLYSQEIEKEMIARNREQFGFRLIDSPKPPDRKIRPQRALTIIVAGLTALLVSSFLAVALETAERETVQ